MQDQAKAKVKGMAIPEAEAGNNGAVCGDWSCVESLVLACYALPSAHLGSGDCSVFSIVTSLRQGYWSTALSLFVVYNVPTTRAGSCSGRGGNDGTFGEFLRDIYSYLSNYIPRWGHTQYYIIILNL